MNLTSPTQLHSTPRPPMKTHGVNASYRPSSLPQSTSPHQVPAPNHSAPHAKGRTPRTRVHARARTYGGGFPKGPHPKAQFQRLRSGLLRGGAATYCTILGMQPWAQCLNSEDPHLNPNAQQLGKICAKVLITLCYVEGKKNTVSDSLFSFRAVGVLKPYLTSWPNLLYSVESRG